MGGGWPHPKVGVGPTALIDPIYALNLVFFDDFLDIRSRWEWI